MYPPLGKDHEVFEKSYCPGYFGKDGSYNNGFYCISPVSPETVSVFCCGTPTHKYCCTGFPTNQSGNGSESPLLLEEESDIEVLYDLSTPPPPIPGVTFSDDIGFGEGSSDSYVGFGAVICGLVLVTVLMTLVACFYCKCCLLYHWKKRRTQLPLSGGLYRIPASSTTCGLMGSSLQDPHGNGNFTHSTNSAFVATSNTTTVLDPWGPGNPPPVIMTSEPRHLPGGPPLVHPQPLRPLLPRTQGQIRQGMLPNFSQSENSSNSSISTISSTAQQATATRPQPQPLSSNFISRTNSIPASSSTADSAIRLLHTLHILQNPTSNSNANLSRSNSESGEGHQRHNYSRNRRSSRGGNGNHYPHHNHQISPVYTLGTGTGSSGSSQINSSAMRELINAVTFNPRNANTLPPPYFLEQYRIRNRVRIPRNPPQNNSNATSTALPRYDEIASVINTPVPSSVTHVNRQGNSFHAPNASQPPNVGQRPVPRPTDLSDRFVLPSSSRRNPGVGVRMAAEPFPSPSASSPTSSTAGPQPYSPLNDLSAPSRRKGRGKGPLGLENDEVCSPSRDISRQRTTLSSNVPVSSELGYDPSGKILNTSRNPEHESSRTGRGYFDKGKHETEGIMKKNVSEENANAEDNLGFRKSDSTSVSFTNERDLNVT